MDLYIKFLAGLIYAYGLVVLNYSVFRIKISGKDKQIMILAIVFGATNFYFKFVEDSNVFLITQVVIYTIAICIIRKYPLIYALVVCVAAIIFTGILDVIATSIAIGFNIATIDEIKNSTMPFVLMHIFLAIVFILIAMVFVRFKLGFSFVSRRFAVVGSLQPSTYIWSFVLVIALGALQFISQNYQLLSGNSLYVIISSLALSIFILYAYLQNKKSVIDRFDKTKRAS